MSGGVFGVDRGIWNHPALQEKRAFSKTEAWLWLLSEASWKDRRVRVAGTMLDIKRGQYACSIRFLAEAWGWHRSKVERFVNVLKTETMIETATGGNLSVITICNYDKYQIVAKPAETMIETPSETVARQSRDKEENQKIIPEEIQEEIFPSGRADALPVMGVSAGKPQTLDAQVYSLGRKLLGKAAGGVITNLKTACSGDLYLALQVLQEASEKGDPMSWVQKRIRTLPHDLAYRGVEGVDLSSPRLKTRADLEHERWEENYYRTVQ